MDRHVAQPRRDKLVKQVRAKINELANYNLLSVNSSKLSNAQINSICKLKDKQWKYGIKSQINWYNKNIKKNDIHNLFYIKSKLIGYTSLKLRTYKIIKTKLFAKYLLFDSLVIDQKYRGKKFSNLLMSFNHTIIKQSGYFSFLICNKEMLRFYQNYKWTKLTDKNKSIIDYPTSTKGMVFNNKKEINQKYLFLIN